MEAKKLKTIEDLENAWIDDERLELINGEIVKRTMTRGKHSKVQTGIPVEIELYNKKNNNNSGWWILSEVSVRYNEYQCPEHDIAGWRKERLPEIPDEVISVTPDWVCEIVSPGHEKKDTVHILNILLNNSVPYYWIISPEQKTLIAYKLIDDKYTVIESIEAKSGDKIKIEPFEEVEFDLDYVFGES